MMDPPTLLRKFISLFWLKKDVFSACYQQNQTWKQRKEFKEKNVEECAWTPVFDENMLKFLESVEYKSVGILLKMVMLELLTVLKH